MYLAKTDRYQAMQYKRCGKSGLLLPRISLGLWQSFGGKVPYETSREMVCAAFDAGITHFDLANNYGPPAGSAEETFGKLLKQDLHPYRDEMVISTKAGYTMWQGPYGDWGSKKYMISSLDQSLKRMGLEYVDIFYHHRPDPETPMEESMDALVTALRQGKCLYVGLSNYNAEQTKQAVGILREMGVHCLIHQPRYSMFDRWVENGLYDVLKEEGVGAIAFSPLAQGMLTGRYFDGIPADSRAGGDSVSLDAHRVTSEKVEKAKKLDKVAQARGQSLAQMALAWVLEKEQTTSVIIGASRVQQIAENLGTLNHLEFTAGELSAINQILGD